MRIIPIAQLLVVVIIVIVFTMIATSTSADDSFEIAAPDVSALFGGLECLNV